MTPTIEQLWIELQRFSGGPRQRRVDATHPMDIYADLEPPDRPGLVVVCGTEPATPRALRAILVEHGARADGRWSLRIGLEEPSLVGVFAALCRDIIACTRSGIDEARLAEVAVGRIERWRHLLERDSDGLGLPVLAGLLGELHFLDANLLETLTLRDAVIAWTGPRGTPQDFLLPTGTRIEVKTAAQDATGVRISGLDQLDSGVDPLMLAVVRVQVTGEAATGAVTVPILIERLRARLAGDADALIDFEAALASAGWHDHPSHDKFAARPIAIEMHDVIPGFPRLSAKSVPAGVEDADYTITLPPGGRIVWSSES